MGYSFDGPTKRIVLTAGTTVLDVRDLYSRWKDWVELGDDSKFLQALSVVGGDPVDPGAGIYITSYFFLENGWKIRPQEADHKLVVSNGVLLTSDASDPFVPTLGSYNVLVQYSQPIKSETVATGGGSGPTAAQVAAAVWDESAGAHVAAGSFGELESGLAAMTAQQVALVRDLHRVLGLDAAYVVEHGHSYIRVPADGSLINIAITKTATAASKQRL